MFNWRELYENLMISISEQAYKRNKAEEIITSEMGPLTEHLIKVLKWEDSLNNKKHIKDVRLQWLKKIKDVLVRSKVKFKKNHLDRIIIHESMDTLDMYLSSLKREYDMEYGGKLKAYRTDDGVELELLRILNELSNRLFNLQETKKDTAYIEDILDYLKIYVYGI